MNIYDEAIKNVKSLDYLAEWYESDVVSDGYEEAKKNRETMTQNVIKTLERAKKVEELLDLYRLQQEFKERYNTLVRLLDREDCLYTIREIAEEIYLKEKEVEELR